MSKRYNQIVAELDKLEKLLNTEGDLEHEEIERILRQITQLEERLDTAIEKAAKPPSTLANPPLASQEKEGYMPSGGVNNPVGTNKQPEKEDSMKEESEPKTRPKPS